jgi:hypothetical protein
VIKQQGAVHYPLLTIVKVTKYTTDGFGQKVLGSSQTLVDIRTDPQSVKIIVYVQTLDCCKKRISVIAV